MHIILNSSIRQIHLFPLTYLCIQLFIYITIDSCTGMSQYLFTLIYNPVLCYLLCCSATGSSFNLVLMSLWGFCFSVIFILFWLRHVACGLLVPWPGSKPTPLALEARSLSHWATREVPSCVPLRCPHHFVALSTALLSDISQYPRFSLCFPCPIPESGPPWWLNGKESCSAGDVGDTGSIPRSGRSPGGGNSNLLQ